MANNPQPAPEAQATDERTILGLSTSELANLTVEELTSNATAIKMVLHYYKQLVNDNITLENNNNILNTYKDAYNTKKSNTATGTILSGVSNIFVAFGVNILTTNTSPNPYFHVGIICLSGGILLLTAGIYFSLFKDKSE